MSKILIVEDSTVVVEKLKKDLSEIGYTNLLMVTSGEEAIKITRNHTINLIIMDITLIGKMNGIEASKIINKSQNIPTIYLTKNIESNEELPGAYAYLNKPFTKNELKYNMAIVLKQHALKKELNAKIQWFSGLFKYSTEGIIMFDEDFIINDINQAYTNIFSYNIKQLVNEPLKDHISSHISFQSLKERFLANKSLSKEKELIFDTGRSKHFFVKGIPIFNNNKYIGGYLMYIDITELKRKEEKIRYISEHDSMTGLFNRRFFQKKLDELCKNKDIRVSLIIGDINDLKRINDTYGHSTGDQYIKLTAKALLKTLPKTAYIARIGGDEFGIILIDKDKEMCLSYSKRITRVTNEFTIKNNLKDSLSLSLGHAIQNYSSENGESLFHKADQKMYQIKRKTKESIDVN